MNVVERTILGSLNKKTPNSHKGQNGRLLIIAGSEKYHGALLLAVQTASRIVDIVYVYTTNNNVDLINKLKSETSTFITIKDNELEETIELVDAIAIGPGMEESESTYELTTNILINYKHKKIVVDATALWHVNKELLHENCVVTPHTREFSHAFGVEPTPDEVKRAAKEFGGVVLLTGQIDYISIGKEIWENRSGHVGMTKGGTGDVLVGLISGLLCSNDIIIATLAGAYLNGLAGEKMSKRNGDFYNSQDIITELSSIWLNIVENRTSA